MLDGRLALVRRKADQWARELIDFGPRNTLLYYRDSRSHTVDLTEANPSALARLLDGRRCRLSSLFNDPSVSATACSRMRTLRRRVVMMAEEQGVEIGRVARGLLTVQPPAGARGTAVRPMRAPLLLQGVRIEPTTAAELDHAIEVDADVEVNPVLLVALRDHHNVEFDLDRMTAQLDAAVGQAEDADSRLDAAFALLEELISAEGRACSMERRTIVGTFAFDKLPMMQDLQNSSLLLAEHDVIAAAAGDEEAQFALADGAGAYRVRDADEVMPAEEFLVLGADSSQHRAVNAVLDGQHVVIQGPPGTGKSQTIANIIAGAAAAGQSVLFVAEKRAAIEAVTERLAQAGLAELVLDLHGLQRTKREVAEQIAASLERLKDAMAPDVDDLHRRLAAVRAELLRYGEETHRPREPWGPSAQEVQVALLGLPEQARTRLRLRRAVMSRLDSSTVSALSDDLASYVRAGGLAVRRGESAWSRADVRKREDAEQVLARLDAVTGGAWRNAQDGLNSLVARAGLRTPTNLTDWQRLLGLLSDVERTLHLHGSEAYGDDLDALCAAACRRTDRADHPTTEGWWRRYRRRRQALARRTEGRCSRDQLSAELRAAVAERALWRWLATDRSGSPRLIGLTGESKSFSDLRNEITAVALTARIDEPDALPVEELASTLERLRAEEPTLFRLPEFARIIEKLEAHGLTEVIDEVARRDASAEEATHLLRYVWWHSLLDLYRLDSPVLATSSADQIDAAVARFRDLDAQQLRFNAARVRRQVAERLATTRDHHPQQNRTVLGEAKRKRGHMTVRALVGNAPDVLLAARPCWAMSPIVVSRLLPARRLFDIVIFDEASQVEPVDAMPSIMRGRQLVVAGDDKQLPPSNYFRTLAGGTVDEEPDEDSPPPPRLGDYESVLACLAQFVPNSTRLRWHYRSEDERLIAFSNHEFYDGDLVTFPGRALGSPLQHYVVEGSAVPGSGGLVAAEVDQVIALVVDHATRHPDEPLGVITANVDHTDRVETALQQAAVRHPALADFRTRMDGPGRRLFVKSLEMVQGDERDAIVLSLGRAKGADGKLRMHFGPINHDGGERRLNVAVTRARRRLHVVSAFTHEDMNPALPRKGPAALRRFLEAAATGARPTDVGRAIDAELNFFEQDVLDALRKRGIPVIPQWGVSGYRIDFALGDPEQEGRMVLAVEADGDTYHRLGSVRDRDRLRQTHLERMGWTFHRIWASAWFDNPDREADRVDRRWHEALTRPLNRTTESPGQSDPPTPPVRRGAAPSVLVGQPIDRYTKDDLDHMARWILSDGRALDRETRYRQMWESLGFSRAGKRIVARCKDAIDRCLDTNREP